MQAKVTVKRLPHCFQPTPRFLKMRSTKAYLDMFPTAIPANHHILRQFDEKESCPWQELYKKIGNDTVTEAELDEFMEAGEFAIMPQDIPYKNFLEIKLPYRTTSGAAGFDLQAAIDDKITLQSGETAMVSTGLCVKLPDNIELQVRPRSGLAAKYAVTVVNTPGTVDSDYTGEIKVILINHGKADFVIYRGDRIAQAVFNEVVIPELFEVNELEKTERGSKGFGSTGR